MTNAIDVQLANTFGGTLLWPMIALSNIAQGSAVLAMIYLQRKNEKSKEVNIPSCISCYLGVTEPAMFGVNLKHSFPFFSAMTGSALAALFSVSTGVMASSIGVGGLPGILSIKPGFWLKFAIAMAIAIVVPFVLTVIFGKKRLAPEDLYGKDIYKEENPESVIDGETAAAAGEFDFVAPMTGRVLDLDDVSDKVFSDRLMGDGFAIELTESDVVSPVDGVVAMTYPSKHAFGIKADSGEEILIHIGMDTVELDGKGFESFVTDKQRIKKGDLLCKVDLDYVKDQGKSLVSPIIFTSGQKVRLLGKDTIKENEKVIELES